MTIEYFLSECNKTPLLKKYRENDKIFTKTLLKKIGFLKNNYEINDLVKLNELLFGFKLPETPEALKKIYEIKRETKDLRHEWLIKKFDNQKFIMQIRKEIEMPFDNRGFAIENKKIKTKLGLDLSETFSNTDFSFSSEFENWFFRNTTNRKDYDESIKTNILNREKMSVAINKVLIRWELPRRYEKAIEELILFNRIIPASSGIKWASSRRRTDEVWEESITFDVDTSKEELIKIISQDKCGTFANKKHFLQGKSVSAKRKRTETEKMIKYYNSEKEKGKKDKIIFQEIFLKTGIKPSTIKKRIKD